MKQRSALGVLLLIAGGVLAGRLLLASPVGLSKDSISGVVQDPTGVPVPAVWIVREGFRGKSGLTPWWRSELDGKFRIDGLPDGEIVLRVIPGDASILTGFLVTTKAGTHDLRITVEPGPQVLVKIPGYEPPNGDPRYARLVWWEADGRRPTRYSPISNDGRVRFISLPKEAKFELWAIAGGGRVVRARDLHTGDTEVTVEAKKGQSISGRVIVGAGDRPSDADVNVEAYPGFNAGSARPAKDGTFTVNNLPEGEYVVSAGFNWGAVSLPVKAKARTGVTDVVLDVTR